MVLSTSSTVSNRDQHISNYIVFACAIAPPAHAIAACGMQCPLHVLGRNGWESGLPHQMPTPGIPIGSRINADPRNTNREYNQMPTPEIPRSRIKCRPLDAQRAEGRRMLVFNKPAQSQVGRSRTQSQVGGTGNFENK